MKAESTNLQVLIEGKKQFIVPLFQRPYTWKRKDWEMLFEDLAWLYENNEIDTHFMGSIVTIPMASAPQNKINKFLLIDGQQRLTTIFVILALLRDLIDNTDTANDINMSYLVNISQKNNDDFYKLLPTQAISSHISDKQALQNIIEKKTHEKHLITDCYQFFETKIKRKQLDIDTLHDIIIRKLSVVSIVLGENDDPYLIFEGLNAKGEPLSQADLIRNYFFMKIDKDKQEKIYNDYWKPMQESLGEWLTEFMRHYIISDGVVSVNKNTVYTTLKNKLKDLSEQAMLDKLEKIYWYAEFYQKLISPEYEKEVSIKNALMRIKQFNVTTAYPFLLKCYNDYENKKFTVQQFVEIIETLENFVMRRFICDIKTNELDSIFNALYKKITLDYSDNFIQGMKSILQTKHYPKDNRVVLTDKILMIY
jgi:uncharacterized protein with ParB-like and HNH nuclease domain